MNTERWKPPWHCGSEWVAIGAVIGLGTGSLMNHVFGEPGIPIWLVGVGGAVLGVFIWIGTWRSWAEFGPNWDGGL